jgi:hypothetical protein
MEAAMAWIRVGRSGIEAIHHDQTSLRLIVHWTKSGYYVFGNVPQIEALNMAAAPNPSAYFRKHIEPHAVKLPDQPAEQVLRLAGR